MSYKDSQGFEETQTTPFVDVSRIPSIAATSSSAGEAEGNSGSTAYSFTVTRTGDTGGASYATWTVSGSGSNPAAAGDFVGGSFPTGTVSFAIGEISRTISINVAGDTAVELDEGFTFSLSAPYGASLDSAATSVNGTIRNDDTPPAPSLTLLSTTTFTEDSPAHGLGSVVATFSTSAALAVALNDTLHYALGSGADTGKLLLTAAGLALVNAGGDLPAFTLTPSQGAIHGSAVSVDPAVIPANDGPAAYAITCTPAAGTTLAVAQLTADPDGPGTAPSITWQSSSSGDSWSVVGTTPTYGLTTADEGKQLRAELTYTDGQGFPETVTTSPRTVPLPPTVAITNATTSLREGNIGSTPFAFTLTRTGDLSGESRVSWAVTGSGVNPATASDFAGGALPAGTAVFAPGQAGVSLAIDVIGDAAMEADEGFQISLSNPIGARFSSGAAPSTGLIVILNDDQPAPTYSFVATPDRVDEGGSLHIGVSATNVQAGQALWWQLSGAGVTGSDFSDGQLTGSVLLGADGRAAFVKSVAVDAVVDPEETATLRFFSDAARTQPLGSPLSITLKEPSVGVVTDGNDVITGTAAAERITGVPVGSTARGQGSLDRLTGGGGPDLFVLGDAAGIYYNDGTPGLGTTDMALIVDFTAGDRIQLPGSNAAYRLVSGRYGGNPGVRLDALSASPGNTPEAIGFVYNATLATLNLTNSNQFLYV